MSNCLAITFDDCVSSYKKNNPTFSFENKTVLSTLDSGGRWESPESFQLHDRHRQKVRIFTD